MRARKGNAGGRGRARGAARGDGSPDRLPPRSAPKAVRGGRDPQRGIDAPPVEHSVRTPGLPLGAELRRDLERRIGHDLSGVRVHTDGEAHDAAAAMQARAFTVGRHIVFNEGEFRPESPVGRKLLAHELAHTMQPSEAGSPVVSRPGDRAEREADRVAGAVMRGEAVDPARVPGAQIKREPLPDLTKTKASDALIESASPFVASAIGSATLDDFETGKAELKPRHLELVAGVAHNVQVLLRKYNLSTLTVTGHTDTVGTEANNARLGQDRADAVTAALVKQGVPAAMIASESRGESAPQAVKTRDEELSARNRRVEIRFSPRASRVTLLPGELKPADPTPTFDPSPPKPPFDPFKKLPPKDEPPNPSNLPPDFWKPIPPAKVTTKSPLDTIAEKVLDPVIDKVAGGLPKWMREKIKEGARDAVKSGVAKGARAAAEAAGLEDSQGLDAIEKAAEAAIQEKGRTER